MYILYHFFKTFQANLYIFSKFQKFQHFAQIILKVLCTLDSIEDKNKMFKQQLKHLGTGDRT